MARSRRRNAEAGAPSAEALPLHMTFRISPELREQLKIAAGEGPIGEEIRRRLEASFAESPAALKDPRFADFLTALAHVTAGAARMYPPRRLEYRGQTVEDITAHWVIEAATHMLLDAFRPEGLPDSLPKEHDAAMVELSRRVDRLVSAALGALGDRGTAAFDNLSDVDQEGLIRAGFNLEPETKP